MDWKQIAILAFVCGVVMLALWGLSYFVDWESPLGRLFGRLRHCLPRRLAGESSPAPPRIVLGPPRIVKAAGLELPPTATPLRRGPPLVLPARADPLWTEKGWRRNGTDYAGCYRAGGQRWQGLIREPYPGAFDAYIWHPPLAELNRRTSHAPCFQSNGGDGCYKVHFYDMPGSLDHAIVSIEAVLAEAVVGLYG